MAITAVNQPAHIRPEPKAKEKDLLDKLQQGLSIASSVFGIKTALEQSELNRLKLEQAEETKRRQDLFNKMADSGAMTDAQMFKNNLVYFDDYDSMSKKLGIRPGKDAAGNPLSSVQMMQLKHPEIFAHAFPMQRASVRRKDAPRTFQPGKFEPEEFDFAKTKVGEELLDSLQGIDMGSVFTPEEISGIEQQAANEWLEDQAKGAKKFVTEEDARRKAFHAAEAQRLEEIKIQNARDRGLPYNPPQSLDDFKFSDGIVVPSSVINATLGAGVDGLKKKIQMQSLRHKELTTTSAAIKAARDLGSILPNDPKFHKLEGNDSLRKAMEKEGIKPVSKQEILGADETGLVTLSSSADYATAEQFKRLNEIKKQDKILNAQLSEDVRKFRTKEPDVRKLITSLSAAQRLKVMLSQKNPVSDAFIMRQLFRLSGDVGQIRELDLSHMGAGPSLTQRFMALWDGFIKDRRITDKGRKQMNQTIDTMIAFAKQELKNRTEDAIKIALPIYKDRIGEDEVRRRFDSNNLIIKKSQREDIINDMMLKGKPVKDDAFTNEETRAILKKRKMKKTRNQRSNILDSLMNRAIKRRGVR